LEVFTQNVDGCVVDGYDDGAMLMDGSSPDLYDDPLLYNGTGRYMHPSVAARSALVLWTRD